MRQTDRLKKTVIKPTLAEAFRWNLVFFITMVFIFYDISAVVIEKLPSPLHILEDKVDKLMCSQAQRFDCLPDQTQKLKQG